MRATAARAPCRDRRLIAFARDGVCRLVMLWRVVLWDVTKAIPGVVGPHKMSRGTS